MSSSLMNVVQVAELLNVSKQWVYDHTERKEPKIPFIRIGGAVRFKRETIEKWLADIEQRVA